MLADMQMWPRTSRSSCLECEPGPYCLLYVHVTRHVSVTSTGSTVYSESQQSAPYTYFICWDQIYLCTAQYGALKQQTNLNFFGAIQRPSSLSVTRLIRGIHTGIHNTSTLSERPDDIGQPHVTLTKLQL